MLWYLWYERKCTLMVHQNGELEDKVSQSCHLQVFEFTVGVYAKHVGTDFFILMKSMMLSEEENETT